MMWLIRKKFIYISFFYYSLESSSKRVHVFLDFLWISHCNINKSFIYLRAFLYLYTLYLSLCRLRVIKLQPFFTQLWRKYSILINCLSMYITMFTLFLEICPINVAAIFFLWFGRFLLNYVVAPLLCPTWYKKIIC